MELVNSYKTNCQSAANWGESNSPTWDE